MLRNFQPVLMLALIAPVLEAQTPRQQVDNLRAFAKAYGYVKYFHPSDEAAQVDWNRFAAHGAERVKEAKNPKELREALTTLFAPLAPSARFHGKAEPAHLPKLVFSQGAAVAWQHLGVSLDSGSRGNVYRSQRVNRPVLEEGKGAGEVVTKAVAPGLMLSFPLALPVAGAPAAKGFAALKQTLAAMPKPSTDQEGVRLGNLVSTWNVFQHFYPYFDVVKADWDAALTQALGRGLKDTTPAEHRVTLQKLVAQLRDGHGAVFCRDSREGDLPARFDWIEDRLVVTAATEGSPLQRGDLVVSVEGVPAQVLLEEAESRVSGSDALRRHRALNIVGYGKVDAAARVVVRRGGKDQALDIPRVTPFGNLFFKSLPEFRHEAFQDLGNGCYYLNVSGLERVRFNELLPVLAKAKGLILDQRPMTRAKDPMDLIDVIPLLAKEPTTSALWQVPRILRPDREGMTFVQSRWPLTPAAQPHLAARVLVINVPSVVSYGESIMGIFEHYKLAEFVGEPTAGCNGNANVHVLPGEIQVTWTGMRVLKHDGSQHHLVGIRPTHPVTRTIKAVEEGRDEYLEKAIALLKGP